MRAPAFLSILTILAVASIACAQEERPGARKEIEAFYAKGDAMVSSGHMAQYVTLFSPNFYFVDSDGRRQEFPTFRANLMSAARVWKELKLKTTVKNVQLQDGEITVWVEEMLSHKELRNGKWVPMTQTTRYADGLGRVGNGWRFVSSQQLFTNEPWSFKTNG
jgi:hypothetical protein